MKAGQFDRALKYYRRAVEVNPYAAFHHANLAIAYLSLNRLDEAAAQLKKAIEIEPKTPRYHQQLALVLVRQQKPAKAIAELNEVLRLSPMDAGTMREIAWFLATSPDDSVRNGKRALELALEANAIAWVAATTPHASIRDGKQALELAEKANATGRSNDPLLMNVLAAAHAELGHYELAVEIANEALKLAVKYNNPDLANSIRNMIKVYSSGRPLRVAMPAQGSNPRPSQ